MELKSKLERFGMEEISGYGVHSGSLQGRFTAKGNMGESGFDGVGHSW